MVELNGSGKLAIKIQQQFWQSKSFIALALVK
jgi:hypothetical protein